MTLETPTFSVVGQQNRADIYYLKKTASANLRESYNNSYFLLKGGVNKVLGAKPEYPATCQVLKRQWAIIDRKCAPNYVSTTPPPPAPVEKTCDTTLNCKWRVKTFPCGWERQAEEKGYAADTWVRNCNGENCELANVQQTNPATNTKTDTCVAEFHCMRPGTYTLTLSVQDGCNTRTEDTTVVCKCAKTLNVQMPVVPNVLKTCTDGSTTRDFRELTLEGRIIADGARNGAPLPGCPTLPAPAAAAPAITTGHCCPALVPCAGCPACAECASCPGGSAPSMPGGAEDAESIPGAVTGAIPKRAEAADVPVLPASVEEPAVPGAILEANAVPGAAVPAASSQAEPAHEEYGSAFVSSEEDEDEVSTSLLLGVVIPISVIIVASMIGNVLLFQKLRRVGVRHLPQ